MKIRSSTIVLLLLILMIPPVLAFLLSSTSQTAASLEGKKTQWRKKELQKESRLLETPIILYHNIDGRGIYSVKSKTLREHFEHFRTNNVKIIPLAELLSRQENPVPFSGKTMVVTFDDGFLAMYTKLLPIAQEFGYPVTVFVYTNNVHHAAKSGITWKQLRELEACGVDIECHTQSHADIEKLSLSDTASSRTALFKEVYLSKRIIETYLKKEVRYFAFPYGRYSLDAINYCQMAGYDRVFSTDDGSNIITNNNYCLRRHHVLNTYSLKTIESIMK